MNCGCVAAPSQRDVVRRPQGHGIDRNFSRFPIVRIKKRSGATPADKVDVRGSWTTRTLSPGPGRDHLPTPTWIEGPMDRSARSMGDRSRLALVVAMILACPACQGP